MVFKKFYLGCLAHASYLIGSEKEAAVVDPQRDVQQYIDEAKAQGLTIKYVIETHLHADFVSGHRELAAKTGAEIVFGHRAGVEFPHRSIHDGDELRIGRIVLRALETPGHTPEGISWLVIDGEAADAPQKSGNRARKAEEALRGSGLTRLHVLEGGMNAWLAASKPPARFGPRRMLLERQVRIVAGGVSAIGGLLALLVNPWFAIVPVFVGSGLVFAGVTDTCAMAMVLSRLPHNAVASCDVPAMVQALKRGAEPIPVGRRQPLATRTCSR